MTCFHPLTAFMPLYPDRDGKRSLIFSKKHQRSLELSSSSILWTCQDDIQSFFDYMKIYDTAYPFPIIYDKNYNETHYILKVPCGKCIGCRLDYSRMWATRSVHEAFMHNHFNNCSFLTLTFNDDMLYQRENPKSLNKTAFRAFLKRLRKAIANDYHCTIRYMLCGEYGSKRGRPHYHMLVYGFNFPDKYLYQTRIVHGKRVFYFRSPFLEKLWRPAYSVKSYGFSVIGDVNYETSAYVARYVTKKLNKSYYENKSVEPEFLLASRNKGLGFSYLEKYYTQIFDNGYIVLPSGFKAPIPRYYYNQLMDIDPEKYYIYTMRKQEELRNNILVDDLEKSTVRLKCKEELQQQRLNKLFRTYEFDKREIARYGYVNLFLVSYLSLKILSVLLHNIHSLYMF